MSIHALNARCTVSYRREILENGKVVRTHRNTKNLILDSGMDMIATVWWHELIRYCHLGKGITPTKRTPGDGTLFRYLAATPNQLRARKDGVDTSFFAASDVGRMMRLDSGLECRITGYTSAAVVTVNVTKGGGVDHVDQVGTIYHVEQTRLDDHLRQLDPDNSLDNSAVWDGPTSTWRYRHTFLGPVETANVAYTEIGWSNGDPNKLFGRDLIPGGGDALTPNQRYRVVVDLYVTIDTAHHDVDAPGDGIADLTGTAGVEDIAYFHPGRDWHLFLASGAEATTPLRDPASDVYGPPGDVSDSTTNAHQPYVSGSYRCVLGWQFVGGENGLGKNGIRAVGIWSGWYWYGNRCVYRVILDAPFDKAPFFTLTIRFVFSWGRILEPIA
ncbi:hypothetical protein OPIT5_16720 [Opitutaceae bacterium TAV5]|nr:hypothetical protein OPIT5_16720 [Opitutaceae bacterium TAV5]